MLYLTGCWPESLKSTECITNQHPPIYAVASGHLCIWCIDYGHFCSSTATVASRSLKREKCSTVAYLGPGVLFAEQVSIEVGHLEVSLVCKAPHQFPVAHMMELLPLLLSFAALLVPRDSLRERVQHLQTYVPVQPAADMTDTHSVQVALDLLDSSSKEQEDGSLRREAQFVWKHGALRMKMPRTKL